jgi:hypothetical protein
MQSGQVRLNRIGGRLELQAVDSETRRHWSRLRTPLIPSSSQLPSPSMWTSVPAWDGRGPTESIVKSRHGTREPRTKDATSTVHPPAGTAPSSAGTLPTSLWESVNGGKDNTA